ncbi:hypothetical protein ACS0TY_020076 [Phlomoides rotata]
MALFRLLVLTLFLATTIVRDATGSRVYVGLDKHAIESGTSSPQRELNLKDKTKRMLIGSVAPTCTYNECRGCKYKCRAEQVPVEGNDPINSPYHYKCVCHR